MVKHRDIGNNDLARRRILVRLLSSKQISLGGNSKLKIYGKLNCRSGRRTKVDQRVFFNDEAEAIALGFRPCGNCMRDNYKNWKVANDLGRNTIPTK